MQYEIQNGALDKIDERNYSYSEIAGNNVEIKDFVCLDDGVIQNQHKNGYPNGCVYFASSMHDNYINLRDGDKARSTGGELCDKSTTRDPKIGDYLINGPKLLKQLDYIKGYFQIALTEMKQVLSEGKPIHAGSNQINRGKTVHNNNIAVEGIGSGHAFHVIGYNMTGSDKIDTIHHIPNNCFICKDSSSSFDNGFFYLKFEDVRLLFYTKIIFENKLDPILSYKKKIMENLKLDSAKNAFEMGIWSGENPNSAVTREECAAMVYRMFEKIAKKIDNE